MASSITNTTPTQSGPGDGPKRNYYRRHDSSGRGVGMWPEDLGPSSGMAVWSEPVQKAPYAAVPAVGDTMTLHASALNVPGYTLTYEKTYDNGSHLYKCGARRAVIHDAAMPAMPEGMTGPPAMLVCSLPLVGATGAVTPTVAPAIETPMPTTDTGLVERTRKLVEQFRQVILYGPPGTGKTRLARQVAFSLLDADNATSDVLENNDRLRDALEACSRGPGQSFDLVVFHPSYEYEQFIGGITANTSGDALGYAVEEGIFLRLCNAKRAVLVIDEINRGNLSKLLGELVYALEYRESGVTLPFRRQTGPEEGHNILKIPKELFVIATMNSSDRSIGHIDVAVRRRFGLVPIEPDPEVVRRVWNSRFPAEDEGFAKGLARVMKEINENLSDDGVELGVGQSYFLPGDEDMTFEEAQAVVRNRWKYQVRPLLDEYDVMVGVHLPEPLKDDDLDKILRTLERGGEAAATS